MSEELTTALWLASEPPILYEFYQVFGQRAHISTFFHSFIRKLQLESSRKLLITPQDKMATLLLKLYDANGT